MHQRSSQRWHYFTIIKVPCEQHGAHVTIVSGDDETAHMDGQYLYNYWKARRSDTTMKQFRRPLPPDGAVNDWEGLDLEDLPW